MSGQQVCGTPGSEVLVKEILITIVEPCDLDWFSTRNVQTQ